MSADTRKQRARTRRQTAAHADDGEAALGLRRSNGNQRILFEQHPYPVWVFDRATFRFLAVNQTALDTYGYSRDEFLDMKATDVRPAEHVADFKKRVRAVRKDFVNHGTFVHRKRDGTPFEVEAFACITTFGGQSAIVALMNDLSERRALEAKLRNADDLVRSILDNSPELVVTVSPDGTFRSFSRSMIILDRDALVGQSIFQFVPADTAAELRAAFDRVLRTGQREVMENRGTIGDMSFWYRGHIGPLREDGAISGLIMTLINMTDEKQLREQLVQVYRDLERRSVELSKAVANLHGEIERRESTEQDLRKSRERLRGLSTRLLSAQEEERRRISREVHDELGQTLTAMNMELSALRRDHATGRMDPQARIDVLESLVDKSIETVRRIARDLRPGALDDLGLEAALEGLLGDFRQRSGVACSLRIQPEELQLDSVVSTTIFRVVQEALTNVARHAAAKEVAISLHQTATQVSLRVRDDGRGIRKAEIAGSSSLGLTGMRERVRLCGGTARISRASDRGTEVYVRIPLRNGATGPAAPSGSDEPIDSRTARRGQVHDTRQYTAKRTDSR